MRLGILADIHANLPALEAAIAVLERERVDRYVHAGDLVGYGPFPNECVERVAAIGAHGVAGNHDLIALDRLPDTNCIPLARVTQAWTKQVLTPSARAFLADLPATAVAPPAVLVAHGSLDDPEEYVTSTAAAQAQLDRARLRWPRADILVLGHTHRAWAYSRERGERSFPRGQSLDLGRSRWLLNPGSVGQSRDRHALARFLLVDLETRTAHFFAIAYDAERTERELRRVGLPATAAHLRPARLAPLRRVARRTANRLRKRRLRERA